MPFGRGLSQKRGGFNRGESRQSNSRGRGGFAKGQFEPDPPVQVERVGELMHACEDMLIYRFILNECVPRFNAYVYTESKAKVGKIDEILGCSGNLMFSVIPEVGIQPSNVKRGATIFLSPTQITPLSRFQQLSAPRGGRGRGFHSRGRGASGSRNGGYGRGGFQSNSKGRFAGRR